MAFQAHLSDDTLAALVEGGLQGEEQARAREHLARCRTCMAAYAEAARVQSTWLEDPEVFAPDDDILRLGLAVPASVGGVSPARHARRVPRHRQAPNGLRPVFLTLGGAAVGLAAVLLWLRPGILAPTPLPDRGVVALVERAAQRTSAHGMVLPFGEGFTVEDMTIYRAGAADADPALNNAILALIDSYERAETSGRAACLLITGQIAAGQIGNARAFVSEALQQHPDDTCLATLAAIIAFRENNLTQAEALLRGVVAREPGNLVASFNLGLLLTETGRRDEARPFLEAALKARAQTPFSSRAESLLEGRVPR